LRNPLIANALYFTSDIERWGSGLKRISNECKALCESGINKIKSGFAVIFHRSKIETGEEVVRKGGQIGSQKRWSEITGKQKPFGNGNQESFDFAKKLIRRVRYKSFRRSKTSSEIEKIRPLASHRSG